MKENSSKKEVSDKLLPGFLQGGGEMGKLIYDYDWSGSTLGPIDTWPVSLKTTLGIMLHSGIPKFLFWGKELVCFYNDAFRPSLGLEGKQHLINKQGKKFWPEVWEFIGPLIEKVTTTGQFITYEDQLVPSYRNGKIVEKYWTFSYSPAYNDEGKINGVFLSCTETTSNIHNLKIMEASKNKLQFAIEAAELGTWDYNPSTGKVKGNERLKDWFGLLAEQDIELNMAIKVIAEQDRQRVVDAIQQALQYFSGGKYDIVFTIVHPATQKESVVRAKGKAWFHEDKTAYRFNGILQDITEQRQIHKKINESEQEIRSLIENAPFPIGVYTGREMQIKFANQTIMDTWGKGNNVINRLFAEILPELDNQEIFKQLDQVFTTGIPFHAENSRVDLLINDKLEPYYFNYSFIPLHDSVGNVYGVMNTAANVTDLILALQKVEESEFRFRSLADQSPLIVFIIEPNAEAAISYWSKAWLEYTGQSFDQALGRAWDGIVHADDVQSVLDIYVPAFQNKQPYTIPSIRLKRHDGVYRWHLFKGSPRNLPNDEFMGYIGVGIDIHEQKLSEDILKIKNQELQKINNDLDNFIYTASHDLKSPVSNIEGLMNALTQTFNPDEEQKIITELINQSLSRFKNTIQDLTQISKI